MVKRGLVGQSYFQPMCKLNKPQHLQLKNSAPMFCYPLKQIGKVSLAQDWVFLVH